MRPLLAALLAAAAASSAGAGPVEDALRGAPDALRAPAPFDAAGVAAEVQAAREAARAPYRLDALLARRAHPPAMLETGAAAAAAPPAVPVPDQLPSMSPMDGLDRTLANGPLPNPRPLKGEPNQELPGYPSSGTELLPSAGEVLGTAPPAGKTYLTPGSALPPLYGGHKTLDSPAAALPPLLSLPGAPGSDAKQPEEDAFAGAGVETPAHAAYTAHPWRVSPALYPDAPHVPGGGMLREPYAAPPASEWQRAYAEMHGAGVPHLPLFHGHVLAGDVHPPTTAYQTFAAEKARLEHERAHYLAALKQRHAAIEHARSFVSGGQAWVDKMKAEWDAWLEKERAKGSTSIVAEEHKVNSQKHVLEELERQQHEDMKRINLYNSRIRQAAMQFKLNEHKAKLEKEAAQQAALQSRLDASRKHQAEVEAKIADVTQKLQDETGATAAANDVAEAEKKAAAGGDAQAPQTPETPQTPAKGGEQQPAAGAGKTKGGEQQQEEEQQQHEEPDATKTKGGEQQQGDGQENDKIKGF